MIDKGGPLYLPIPVVFAPEDKVYKNLLMVIGTWMKDAKDEKKYFLEVLSVEETG